MPYKWNEANAKNYAQVLSNKLTSEFFQSQTKITGREILKFTEIKQLNLLIVKSLYEKWQQEMSKVKSPYFDFDNEQVQKAFSEFKNIVSQHISVGKREFEELLEQSTYDLLRLNLDTTGYFEGLLRNLPDFKLSQEWLKSTGKYYVSHSWVLAELLSKKQGLPVVYANQAIEWMKEIVSQRELSHINEDLEKLNSIHPLELGSTPQSTEPKSFFEEAFDFGTFSTPSIEKQEPLPVNEELKAELKIEEEIVTPQPKPIEQAPQKQKVIDPLPSKAGEPFSLNDKHLGSTKTLNERMVLESSSLGDSHSQSKIESIRSNISLNQRFLFINNLFGGNVQAFTIALDEIESKSTFGEAREMMIKKYLPQYKWDVASPEAEEFFEILKRRFG